MKELLSYIFLVGEKVKLRNQLAFFKSFCCVQLVAHIGIRLVVLELVHALTPIGCCVLFVENSIDFFMAHLLYICFCWMVLFIYEDRIS